ncbi:hypothetical protein [Vibrio sp. 10N.247.311.51]|uniref:hypothetical protein n=1 Tax=Vibrio sp. 10N.247.311.51 TaxID=3229996 RepID=UPI00354DD420
MTRLHQAICAIVAMFLFTLTTEYATVQLTPAAWGYWLFTSLICFGLLAWNSTMESHVTLSSKLITLIALLALGELMRRIWPSGITFNIVMMLSLLVFISGLTQSNQATHSPKKEHEQEEKS